MTGAPADQDLLIGVLALQLEAVRPEDLVAAVADWTRDRSRSLEQVLRDRGALTLGLGLAPLAAMARACAEDQGGAAAALRALPRFATVREPLGRVADADLQAVLARADGPAAADPHATVGETEPESAEPPPTQADTLPPSAPDPLVTQAEPPGSVVDTFATLAPTGMIPPAPGATPAPTQPMTADPHATLAPTETATADPYATQVETQPATGVSGPAAAPGDGRGDPTWGTAPAPATPPGLRFLPLRKHAEGGLGEIYLARDEELDREVALKEIKGRYADHPRSRARFQFEAEITGGLEHPGIVPVYGLGRYPDGRPYYAMRFIRGDSLKAAVERYHRDKGRDPGRDALARHGLLRRFVGVCDAMAYAHSRRVIHRDLKPDNVMLGPFGETLVVDWGLAKPLDQAEPVGGLPELTPLRPASGSHIAATQFGTTVGTPAYMPPEQAAGLHEQMGPASDIYSLGATLYHLLTGRAPVSGESVATVLHSVRVGQFPPPRQVDPAIPRALEAICLKAMALRPEDRYPTARALGEDVEHWLADEPVSAYREPWPVRLARWGRRHKTAVTGVAALLITAVVALAIGNYLIGREQARTERNYQLARAAVEQMLTEVGAVELADVPQMEAVRRRLLQRALAFYLTFLQERGNEAALRQDAAEAHTRLADIQEMLGAYDQAEPQYRQAIALLTALAAAAPEAAAPHRALAQADHGYGLLLRKANRFGEAEARLREALRLRERLVAAAPADPDDRQRLADTRYFLGALLARQARHAEDEALYQQALAEQERLVAENRDRPEYRGTLARYLNNVGILRSATGRPEAAEAAFREAEAIQQALMKSFPAMPGYRWQLARTASNLANLQIASGRAQPAEADFRRALALQEALAADYPKVPDYRSELAVISSNLGLLLTKLGRGPEAEDAFRRALGLQRALVAEFPRRPDDRQRLAVTDLNLAIVLEATAPAEARALYAEAIGAQEAIVGLYPTVPEYRGALGQSLWNLASFQFSRGAAAEALPILERGIGQLRTALEADGRNRSYRTALRAAQADLAVALIQKGDHAGAAAAAEEVPRLVPDEPDSSLRAAGYLARCGVIAGADARLPEPRRRELREDYARRAVAVLRQAVGLGVLANPRDLDRPELEPLRDRADMRAIRQDLDARATPRVG